MITDRKEIVREVIGGKIYYRDELIDKRFIMHYENCKYSRALKIIRDVNNWARKELNKDPSNLYKGNTALSWYWKYKGFIGEFI